MNTNINHWSFIIINLIVHTKSVYIYVHFLLTSIFHYCARVSLYKFERGVHMANSHMRSFGGGGGGGGGGGEVSCPNI